MFLDDALEGNCVNKAEESKPTVSAAQCMQSHLLTGLVKHQYYTAALEFPLPVGHYHR